MIRKITLAGVTAAALLAGPALAQDASGASQEELDALTQGYFTDPTRTELIPQRELEDAFAQMDPAQRALVLDHCGEVGMAEEPAASSGWSLLCEAVLTD